MGEIGLALSGFLPDGGPPRLIRFIVGAGRNFFVVALSGQPDFNVVSLGGAGAHIARTENHRSVRQPKFLQNPFGVRGQLVQLFVALLGPRELHQLHFLKLVLPDDPPHIPPIGTRFAAEARRIRTELNRKLIGVQRFVAEEVRYRNLGRRRQPEIGILAMEQVFGELRQLPGSLKARRIDQKRRQHFGVTMLARVDIQHEVDQRPLQLGPQPDVHGEPCARYLGRPLHIQNVQCRPQVPVRLRREVKLRRRSPAADFHVILAASAHRNRLVRNIRDAQQNLIERRVHRLQLFIQRGDGVANLAHLPLAVGRVLTGLAKLRDFGALRVSQSLQLLGFGDGAAALSIQRRKFLSLQFEAAGRQPLLDRGEVVSKVRKIVHLYLMTGT